MIKSCLIPQIIGHETIFGNAADSLNTTLTVPISNDDINGNLTVTPNLMEQFNGAADVVVNAIANMVKDDLHETHNIDSGCESDDTSKSTVETICNGPHTIFETHNLQVSSLKPSDNFCFQGEKIMETLSESTNVPSTLYTTTELLQGTVPLLGLIATSLLVCGNKNEKVLYTDLENNFKICVANADDIPIICDKRYSSLGIKSHRDYLLDIYKHYPDGFLLVKDLSTNEIIGSILAINFKNIACGGMFFMEPEYRNRGIGSKLWEVRKSYIQDRILVVNSVMNRLNANRKLGMTDHEKVSLYQAYNVTPQQLLHVCDDLLPTLHINECANPLQTPLLPSVAEREAVKFFSINDQFNAAPTMVNIEDKKSFLTSIRIEASTDWSCPPKFWSKLMEFDTSIHCEDRGDFLRTLLTTHSHTYTVAVFKLSCPLTQTDTDYTNLSEWDVVECVGYGVLRPKYIGYTIAPMYATHSDYACIIFKDLCTTLANLVITQWDNANFDHPLVVSKSNKVPPSKELELIKDVETPSVFFDLTCFNEVEEDDETMLNTKPRKSFLRHVIKQFDVNLEKKFVRMFLGDYVPLPRDKIYFITTTESFIT